MNPAKSQHLVWRASIDRLATRSNLSARGITLDYVLCHFCEASVEYFPLSTSMPSGKADMEKNLGLVGYRITHLFSRLWN